MGGKAKVKRKRREDKKLVVRRVLLVGSYLCRNRKVVSRTLGGRAWLE